MARRSFSFSFAEFVFLILLFLSGLALAFSGGGFVVNFQRVGFSVVTSLQKAVYSVCDGVTGVFTAVAELKSLKAENQELKEKLKNYEFLQRNNTEIRKENERLREQLQFATHIEQKNFPAQIIGRNPDNIYSGITINKGARSGIKKGFPVIAIQSGNVGIVGKVVTAGLDTSLVMPVYDTKCNISARIQNTRDIGIVSGNGSYGSPLNLQYIRKRVFDSLNHGDIVVTSGENGNYVKDVPIGRISKIKILDYDSSLSIELEPVIDFLRLENVLVVDQKNLNDKPPLAKN